MSLMRLQAKVVFAINITATDPQHTGNNIRNIRLVYAPTATNTMIDPNETLLGQREIFQPDFIAASRPFRTVRFMKWMNTVGSFLAGWSDFERPCRPHLGLGKYRQKCKFALCNKIGADGWFNMPILSN